MRCERPFCTDCLRDAPVGFQCVECLGRARNDPGTRRAVTLTGAEFAEQARWVPALIAVNAAVFLLTAVQGGGAGPEQIADTPAYRELVLTPSLVAAGQWWRLFTNGFVHLGLVHIALNMLSLWFIGRDLERLFGHTRFLAVYLISLFGASTSVMLFDPRGAVGASGAIFGLLGALLVTLLRLRRPPGQLLFWIGLNVALTFMLPVISVAGHLGGLAVGTLAAFPLLYAPPRRRNLYQVGSLAALTAALALLTLVAAT